MRLQGNLTDFGDLIKQERWIVKGKHLNIRFYIGAPKKASRTDRVAWGVTVALPTGKVDVSMDLQADKKVALSVLWEDEMGNPTDAPENGDAVTYSVDNPDVITLTDNGDGSAVAAATGALGNATVHATAGTASADLLISVVAGDAERFIISAGDPEEVTPDV